MLAYIFLYIMSHVSFIKYSGYIDSRIDTDINKLKHKFINWKIYKYVEIKQNKMHKKSQGKLEILWDKLKVNQ